jgi:O-antigen/teichoic acid export membrane protein
MVGAALAVATFPEFAAATSGPGRSAARELFVRTQLLTTACILLIAVPLAIHFGPVLRIWTRDDTIVRDGLVPGVLLLAALAVTALSNPAYTFLVASGHPRIPLAWNLIALPIAGVGLILLVPRLGLAGAAIVVLVTNSLGFGFLFAKASKSLALRVGNVPGVTMILFLIVLLLATNLASAKLLADLPRVTSAAVVSAAIGSYLVTRIYAQDWLSAAHVEG